MTELSDPQKLCGEKEVASLEVSLPTPMHGTSRNRVLLSVIISNSSEQTQKQKEGASLQIHEKK